MKFINDFKKKLSYPNELQIQSLNVRFVVNLLSLKMLYGSEAVNNVYRFQLDFIDGEHMHVHFLVDYFYGRFSANRVVFQ